MPLVIPDLRAERAVLVLLSDPHTHAGALATAAAATSSRLLVVLLSSPGSSWNSLQSTLTFAYTAASQVVFAMEKPLMDIDVVIGAERGASEETRWDRVFRVGNATVPAWLRGVPTVDLPAADDAQLSVAAQSDADALEAFPVVALGGTFDHLHAGHKILLSMAASVATRKVIVGVTDDALLVRKKNKHLLESLDIRIARVRDFLHMFKPSLQLEIVPIQDVYGPTAWDADVQALVVSRETLPGAASIAELRSQKNLPELKVFIIDVVSSDASQTLASDLDAGALVAGKMSSTAIRQWIADHGQQPNAS
ncbi:Nucleotidylyl transferase [Auriculariales sp. MPI-PUGE-AT-0066]|nr:Nucleotidylyl transferase [Auriculariales sp. MPI-PUGE-AT-0066]